MGLFLTSVFSILRVIDGKKEAIESICFSIKLPVYGLFISGNQEGIWRIYIDQDLFFLAKSLTISVLKRDISTSVMTKSEKWSFCSL
jgi:hypothetical protein